MTSIRALSLAVAVAVAVGAGVLLAVGTHLQSRAVAGRNGELETLRQRAGLVTDRLWLTGGVVLMTAIAMQLWTVSVAPVTVVQPLGISALVVAALIRSRSTIRVRKAPMFRSVALCVLGVTVFVSISARFSNDGAVTEQTASQLLTAVLLIAGVAALLPVFLRGRLRRAMVIGGAGVLFGSVVTLSKVLLTQLHLWSDRSSTALSPTTLMAVGAALAGTAILGSVLVQMSHRSSTSEFVVASLTVIDPLTAVALGGLFLGELAGLPIWAALMMTCAGGVAVVGVVELSRDPALARYAELGTSKKAAVSGGRPRG